MPTPEEVLAIVMLFSGGRLGDLEKNHCMSDNLEVVRAENGILRRKLQSKTEGLLILSQEVQGLREELRQAQALNTVLGRQAGGEEGLFSGTPATVGGTGFSTSSARERNRILLHRQLRSKVVLLQQEREGLALQLEEARGDIAVWRERGREARGRAAGGREAREQREERVRELEEVQVRQTRLKHDLQRLLDEREDLVREKGDLAGKLHRVSHQLREVLAQDHAGLLDIDHIIMENRYLTERLARTQEEKELANQMGRRYKEALEGSRSVKCGEGRRERIVGLLRQHSFPAAQPVELDTVAGLEKLAASLLETLQDRQLQVAAGREGGTGPL